MVLTEVGSQGTASEPCEPRVPVLFPPYQVSSRGAVCSGALGTCALHTPRGN